jgi:hypothetical protein
MLDSVISVTGSETSVEKFRSALLADLQAAGVPSGAVEISAAGPVRRPVTKRAPLGHIEWVQIGIAIGQAVVTSGLEEIVKQLIQKQLAVHKLKTNPVTER